MLKTELQQEGDNVEVVAPEAVLKTIENSISKQVVALRQISHCQATE